MLVLTRKEGETVVLGNSIRVTVVDVGNGSVRLGFEAPSEVSIYREEIYDEIARANRAAVEDAMHSVGAADGSRDGPGPETPEADTKGVPPRRPKRRGGT